MTVTPLHSNPNITSGNYATEEDASRAFDAIIARSGAFKIYREVPGTLAHPRPDQPAKGMRIDRLLVPSDTLLAAGWTRGVIGVEIKRSGIKIGPALSQALDYSHSVFTLPVGGIKVWPTYTFVFPALSQGDAVGSFLAQNRLGTAGPEHWCAMKLYSGNQSILVIRHDHTFTIGTAAAAGEKAGSR